jgi:hypothetical protein
MAVNNKTGIAGHDIWPTKFHADLVKLFKDYLPGFSVNAEYNLTPRAATQWAAAQTGLFLHNGDGPHRAVRDAITDLLAKLQDGMPVGSTAAQQSDIITKRLATLYQWGPYRLGDDRELFGVVVRRFIPFLKSAECVQPGVFTLGHCDALTCEFEASR